MKIFLRNVLATFVGVFLFFAFMLLVVSGMAVQAPPHVPNGAFLVFDLSLPIADKPSTPEVSDIFEAAIMGTSAEWLSLREVTEALAEAAVDDRIAGLYLCGEVTGSGLLSGWAALKEVREAIERFKASGKKVYAYNMSFGEKAYYLASVADPVCVHPVGVMEFDGFASERRFFARAFEKYGIEMQVTRVGDYKSAVEPYLLEKMSDASKEQVQAYLDDLYGVFLDDIGKSRGIERVKLEQIADEVGLLEGQGVVDAGLADRAVYFDELLGELMSLSQAGADERTFRQVRLVDYIEAVGGRNDVNSSENRIALIYAEGDIVDGEDETVVGGDTLARLLRKARTDEQVKAVVLRVNSPGGSAFGSEVILREVKLTQEKKPVVVSMGTVAASGGYWISVLADEIVAEPNTITGSIGVFGMYPKVKELMNNIGITVDVVRTAPHADMYGIHRPMTKEELDICQRLVDATYEAFLDRVCEGRGLEREKVMEIAQGRVWSGLDALEIGLVDELGGLDFALDRAAERAGLGLDYTVYTYQEEKNFFEKLMDRLSGEEFEGDEIARIYRGHSAGQEVLIHFLEGVKMLGRLNDPKGVYTRMPYDMICR